MFELVQESLARILDDHAGSAGAAAGSPESARGLGGTLEEAGMLDVLAGWGGEAPPIAWRDGAALFVLLGEKAPDGPVAEAILGRALVAAAGGAAVPALTVATTASASLQVADAGGKPVISGSLQVPWNAIAEGVVVPVRTASGWRIAVLGRDQAQTTSGPADGRDSRGEPRGEWTFTRAEPSQWLEWQATADARLPGAAMRAAQIGGAMKAALALSMQYANDRVQFARPISKNQAIQHNLALMAEHAALTGSGGPPRLGGRRTLRVDLAGRECERPRLGPRRRGRRNRSRGARCDRVHVGLCASPDHAPAVAVAQRGWGRGDLARRGRGAGGRACGSIHRSDGRPLGADRPGNLGDLKPGGHPPGGDDAPGESASIDQRPRTGPIGS